MEKKIIVAMLFAMFLFSSSTFFVTTSATPNGYKLLIVAPEEFIEALQPLKDFKDATNRPTLLLSLEGIYVSFVGDDTAEKVKKCIAEYENTYGIEHVLLVGDSDRFPVRYTYKKRINTTENTVLALTYVPSDLYYADLYYEGTGDFCSWDANGNGFYGEIIYDFAGGSWHEPDLNIDDLDLRPDVAVGRVPASTLSEVERYVDKVITYELDCSPDTTWFKKALFVSGVDAGMWNPGTKEIPQLNEIATLLGGLSFTTIKLYDDDYPPNDGVPNSTSINSYLNDGVGFMNVHCHGSRGGWDYAYSVPTGMSGLSNQDNLPIIYSMSCHIGAYAPQPHNEQYIDENNDLQTITYVYPVSMAAFTEPTKPNPLQDSTTDKQSPTEYFLVSYDTKGAIASIAPSDKALTGATEYLNDGFFDGYETGHTVLGDVWNHGINYYCDNYWATPATGKGGSMSKLARYHLFGDPSLAIGGLPDKPPTTTKTVGVPFYEDTFVFVTSSTPHTLTGTDDSVIVAYYYRYYPVGSIPPIYQLYTDPFVMVGDDGPYVIEYYSVDDGGNWDFPIKSQVEYLDNAPPAIMINSPTARDYLHSETMIIDFDVTDDSGVALVSAVLDGSPVNDGDTIDVLTLTLNGHTLTITAEDNLGNSAPASVTFNVVANVDSLIDLVERFYADGQIDDPEVRDGLLDKLYAAKALIDANKIRPSRNILRAFIRQVEAQLSHHITEEQANTLLTDAQYTIDHL